MVHMVSAGGLLGLRGKGICSRTENSCPYTGRVLIMKVTSEWYVVTTPFVSWSQHHKDEAVSIHLSQHDLGHFHSYHKVQRPPLESTLAVDEHIWPRVGAVHPLPRHQVINCEHPRPVRLGPAAG